MMFTALLLGVALLLTLLSLGCVASAAAQHPRSWAGVPSAALMTLSTIAMVLPMLAPGLAPSAQVSPLLWAVVMLVAGLLALTTRQRRADSAMTAASSLIMAVMWLAMGTASSTPAASPGVTSSTTALAESPLLVHLHSGAAVAQFAVLLGVVAVLAAALLTTTAMHNCWRQNTAARRIRVATLHHPSMALGMLLMGVGMTAPALAG